MNRRASSNEAGQSSWNDYPRDRSDSLSSSKHSVDLNDNDVLSNPSRSADDEAIPRRTLSHLFPDLNAVPLEPASISVHETNDHAKSVSSPQVNRYFCHIMIVFVTRPNYIIYRD